MFTKIAEHKMAWRQTTIDIYRCKICGRNLKGIEGYFITSDDYYWKDKFCCECYLEYSKDLVKKLSKNIEQLNNLMPNDTEKTKRFNKLIKLRVLKKLQT